MFNRFIGVGNLVRDPEIKQLPNGLPMAKITVAFNTRYQQNGDVKEEVLFLDAITFGKQAEGCKKYLSKGQLVLVEGRLKERTWEQDGMTRRRVELIVSSIKFLEKKREGIASESIQEEALSNIELSVEPF